MNSQISPYQFPEYHNKKKRREQERETSNTSGARDDKKGSSIVKTEFQNPTSQKQLNKHILLKSSTQDGTDDKMNTG